MAFVQSVDPCPVIICCNSHLLQSSKRARDHFSKLNNSSQQEQDSHKNHILQMSNGSSLAHIDLLCSRKRSFMGILNEVQSWTTTFTFPRFSKAPPLLFVVVGISFNIHQSIESEHAAADLAHKK